MTRITFLKARYALGLTTIALLAATTIVYVIFSFQHQELRAFLVSVTAFVTFVVAIPLCVYESNQHFTLQDARDRLAAQQREIEEARDHAERAHRAKSQFLANMSHEIRTPMNGVVGMASLLKDTALTPQQHEMIAVIIGSGESLLRVINDILDFSRIEAGKLSIDAHSFDLRAVVDDVAALMALKAQQKGIELTVRFQPGLAQNVIGDCGRIRQVLTNLVGNAVKFTEQGLVSIDVSGGNRGEIADLVISVSDTGCGIPNDKLSSIFEKFEQVDNSNARRFGGSGLGLAIASQLVGAMGGSVTVDSELGKGSTFTTRLSLPIDASAPAAAFDPSVLDGVRALIVDDSPVNGRILEEQLQALGAKTTLASDGQAALQIVEAARLAGEGFDIGIVDKQMPSMDGRQFAWALKRDARFETMPLVLLSSADRRADPTALADGLFVAYLTKPARYDVFVSTLASALSEKAAAQLQSAVRDGDAGVLRTDDPAPYRFDASVLVAEDNIVNQMVVRSMLLKLGCKVHFAADGVEAVEQFAALEPDLVLMDISMPRLGGEEAAARIRALQAKGARACPLIAATAHAMRDDVQRFLSGGFDEVVTKPLKFDELASALEKSFATRPTYMTNRAS